MRATVPDAIVFQLLNVSNPFKLNIRHLIEMGIRLFVNLTWRKFSWLIVQNSIKKEAKPYGWQNSRNLTVWPIATGTAGRKLPRPRTLPDRLLPYIQV